MLWSGVGYLLSVGAPALGGASVLSSTAPCSTVRMHGRGKVMLGGGKKNQFFFLDLFLLKVLSLERDTGL